MKIQDRSLSPIRWIAIAFGIIALVGGCWWVNEKLGVSPYDHDRGLSV